MLINEKVAYLKGIIDATNISTDKPEGKLLVEIVDALELIAFELADQQEEVAELSDYVEEIDEDLADLEAYCWDDDCDCDCGCDCDCCDCDDEECCTVCDCDDEETAE